MLYAPLAPDSQSGEILRKIRYLNATKSGATQAQNGQHREHQGVTDAPLARALKQLSDCIADPDFPDQFYLRCLDTQTMANAHLARSSELGLFRPS